MNFQRGVTSQTEPDIHLIPFIDVLLVILIFLMVTTTYNQVSELRISLPFATGDTAKETHALIRIGVNQEGAYKINDTPFARRNVKELSEALTDITAQKRSSSDALPIIIIYADRKAMHQSIIDILEAAKIAGLSKITFAAQDRH